MTERNLIVTLHRKRKPLWARRYLRLDTAIPRITELMILGGEPGDVAEIAHAVTGMQIGTVRLRAGGNLITNWSWDK